MIFLYRHVELGGRLVRADEPLLMYRFHAGNTPNRNPGTSTPLPNPNSVTPTNGGLHTGNQTRPVRES
eukprot:695448-Prorocentrum_minimum.AAC.1